LLAGLLSNQPIEGRGDRESERQKKKARTRERDIERDIERESGRETRKKESEGDSAVRPPELRGFPGRLPVYFPTSPSRGEEIKRSEREREREREREIDKERKRERAGARQESKNAFQPAHRWGEEIERSRRERDRAREREREREIYRERKKLGARRERYKAKEIARSARPSCADFLVAFRLASQPAHRGERR